MTNTDITNGEPSTGYFRIEDQILWYDRKSVAAQSTYRRLQVAQIVSAALVPIAALIFREDAIYPGILGALILIIQGIQELGSYHRNWIKYRTACETLRHEKFLYLGNAGPYESLSEADARRMMVERVEAMVSEENTHWSSHLEAKKSKDADTKTNKRKTS